MTSWVCIEGGLGGSSSRQPSYFFLSRQEEVTKKKATPASRRAAPGALRYSGQPGGGGTPPPGALTPSTRIYRPPQPFSGRCRGRGEPTEGLDVVLKRGVIYGKEL